MKKLQNTHLRILAMMSSRPNTQKETGVAKKKVTKSRRNHMIKRTEVKRKLKKNRKHLPKSLGPWLRQS